MNGPHDMGGMQCYGPVQPEKDEPVFHDEWEKRALALTVAMGFCGVWNIDKSRFARECLPPDFYLSKSYYQIWIAGLERLMLDAGLATESEIESGKSEAPAREVRRVVKGEEMPAALAAGGPVGRAPSTEPGFAPGEKVRTLNIHPATHTRLPRYVRGKTGTIERIQGYHVFPDTNASGGGENPQWLYNVAFEARELFGPDAEPGGKVMVDCWGPYLEHA